MAYLSELLIFTIGLTAAWGYSISTPASEVHKRVGDSVTLACEIAGTDWPTYSEPLTWTKTQGTEMSPFLNFYKQEEPFTGERFPTLTAENPPTKVNPQILDLQVEDSGKYTCAVGPYSVVHTLYVVEAVQNLTLWGYEQASSKPKPMPMPGMEAMDLTYEQGKPGFVECRAVGGLPPPTLRLIDTSTDRTFELTEKRTSNITEGQGEGMRKMTYVSYIQENKLMLEHNSDGHKLRCEAHLGAMDDLKMTTEKTINLLYVPYIKDGDCMETYNAKMGMDRKITCHFYSKPAPKKASWVYKADGKEFNDDYQLLGDNKWSINLKLESVVQGSLGEYQLRVENSVGNMQYKVTVREGDFSTDETQDGSDNAAVGLSATTHSLLTAAVLVLLTFLQL